MRVRFFCLAAIGGFFGAGLCVAAEPQAKEPPAKEVATAEAPPRDADREAILRSGRDFAAAFEKGDAKALGALWSEQAEYETDDGVILRGRTAIEAAFAARFKEGPAGSMEIKVEEVRFPSRDLAIEEGLTRTTPSDGLPDSSYYRAVHVREDGHWRIALSREWGSAEDRLSDLDWLIGTWRAKILDHEMVITFSHEKDQPFLIGEFASTVGGKNTPLGTMKIGMDPTSRLFKSWHFDSDGGHGHGYWLRERNHWMIDSQGDQADGTPTAAVNVLSRFGSNEIGWRAIDRVIGGRPQPDLPPIRLKRVPAAK